jgi:tRNA/tmRNA/rRNA uracil-C5-methylase (TrmA/RlmC/RlmD family)
MTFAETVFRLAAERRIELPAAQHPEVLAALDYAAELELKRDALAFFWREHELPGRPEPVVAAPLPRGYRTTSKRRASHEGGRLALRFPGAARRHSVSPSVLDPREHVAIFAFLVERLARPGARPLAVALNHAIVRGSSPALTLILNVRVFDAAVVRAAKHLGEALQQASLGVRAAFLYLDPSGSEYYLEARRPSGTLSFKRLFGPDWLEVEVGDVRLRFPPTVFSQVNGAMLPVMTATARELLAPLEGHVLLDLYCGYGLFALTLGRDAVEVLGVDVDGPAIAAARASSTYLRCADRVRFVAGRIDAELIESRVRTRACVPQLVLLDPPRQGTAPDVIAALAARQPSRVLHICCGTDEIPREVAAWSQVGFRLERAIPLDMFAGTAGLETLLLLRHAK